MSGYGEMFTPEGIQFRWNSHSILDAETCLRKYQYLHIEKWRPRSHSVHLWFGGIFANAMQRYYLARADGADREAAIDAAVELALIESWDHERDAEGNRIPGTGGPWESPDPSKDRFTLIRGIVWYFEEYRNDIEVVSINGAPAVETRFELDLDNGNTLVGTLDRLVRYDEDSLFIMDQKTSKAVLDARYFNGYKPDMQMSAYTFAGRAVFQMPIQGIVIDAMQTGVGFSRFARGLTFRADSELEEWYATAMYHIEAAQRATREQHFPMNTASCGNYGGCMFRKICAKSPEVRANFLKGDFDRA